MRAWRTRSYFLSGPAPLDPRNSNSRGLDMSSASKTLKRVVAPAWTISDTMVMSFAFN